MSRLPNRDLADRDLYDLLVATMEGLTGDHFARWLGVLERTVDERFAGQAAIIRRPAARRAAPTLCRCA